MAGYPNGYVWNEAAKACQFGYLDGNGNFHSGAAASARTRVPNTADGNSLMMFLFSCVTALGAAFLLRRDH